MNRLVAVLEGDDWKRVRAIMTPTFSTGKLKRMRPMLDECINILVTNIQKIIDKVQIIEENPITTTVNLI